MKSAIVLLVPAFALLTLLGGCAPSKDLYYWGNYSSTLYDFKKSPDEKTSAAHRKELLVIIEKSGEQKRNVPPGVYAECGYYLLKEGKEAEGMTYLDKETAAYPESATFIGRIKQEYARGKK